MLISESLVSQKNVKMTDTIDFIVRNKEERSKREGKRLKDS